MRIKEFIAEEIKEEKRLLRQVCEKRKKYPEKTILISRTRNGYERYYCREKPGAKIKYIKISDENALRKITYGRVLKAQAKILEENISRLEGIQDDIRDYDTECVIESLPKTYRNIISRLKADTSDNIVVQSENQKHPENLKVVCSNGLLVRSKNEMAIAEMLIMYNIKFRYEMALELSKIKVDSNGVAVMEKVTVYPDFTIFLPDGTVIYWEHFGLLDKEIYRDEFKDKVPLYYDNNIYPPKNLIITMDGPGKPFDSIAMRRIITERILPLYE